MSPEQAMGKPADTRSDLWAFGVIVLEMLTGRPVFAGTTDREVTMAVADLEPDWALLPPETPTPLRTLLRRCLEKDRTRRLDSAAAARLEIEDAIAVPAGSRQVDHAAPRRKMPAIALSGLAAGVVVGSLVAYGVWPAPVAPASASRFAITASSNRPLNLSWDDRDITVTPDGRHFAYLGGGGLRAGAAVMVRAADQLDAYQVNPGTLGLFPSFDSRWLGLFANGELQKVSIDGGAAITLTRIKGGARGASWGDDNFIVFATDDPTTGLLRVSADGGDPKVLTTPDPTQQGTDHAFPSVLPGGRGVLFTITTKGQAGSEQVAVLDLSTGERKTLVRGATQAQYVDPSVGDRQIGYLLYAASGALRAVRFDLARLAVVGDPVTVVEGVMTKPTGAANYAVSRQGTLFYVTSGVAAQIAPTLLVWVDRSGREQPLDVPPRSYGPPRISPDGTQVAFNLIDQHGADIWILNLTRRTTRRLTFEPGVDGIPIWTPDGRRIIHSSDRTGVYNVYALSSDGSGGEARLTTSANAQYPTSIAPDGTVVGFEGLPIPVPPDVSFRAPSVSRYPSGRGRPKLVRRSLAAVLSRRTLPRLRVERVWPARNLRVSVPPGRQWPLASVAGRRDSTGLVAERSRDFFSRSIQHDDGSRRPGVRRDVQLRPAGEGLRCEVRFALPTSPLRRVARWAAVPDAKGRGDGRGPRQHGGGGALVRGIESAPAVTS